MPDYNNNCIYKICCKDENIKELYIGHTTNFKRRKWQHKSDCNNEKKRSHSLLLYQFIRANGGWDNWNVVKLYDHPCDSRTEACTEERKCMEKFKCKLNINNSYLTDEERIENKKECDKLYNEKNKEKIKEYNEKNKEKRKHRSKEYRVNNLEKLKNQTKEYYQNNKDRLVQYANEYHHNNREKIRLYKNQQINCPNCNKLTSRSNIFRHINKYCKKSD